MKIDDFVPGTAFITICRDDFKDSDRFNRILAFLDLPLDTNKIDIKVNNKTHSIKYYNMKLREVSRFNYEDQIKYINMLRSSICKEDSYKGS